MRINIKPLSVNGAFQGRRFKSPKYKAYETELLYKLPELTVGDGRLQIDIIVGFSNKASDIDNILKPFIDILQKKYNFDDNQIYRLVVDKVITAKGSEFVEFELKEFELKEL